MTDTVAPSIPVKAVFRKCPPLKGISGALVEQVEQERFDAEQVMAILPYQTLPPGMKADGMVAMVGAGGERLITHYRTIIENTLPADEDDYAELLHQMTTLGGYEVEVIQCTNIDHTLRRAERVGGDTAPEAEADEIVDEDITIEVEDITIEVEIINDDIEAGAGFGGDTFTEDNA